jgi:hypothetical protein
MTRTQFIGAASALALALLGLYAAERTVLNPLPTRACVTWPAGQPAGLQTTRFYNVRVSPAIQSLLGLAPTGEWEYVAMEIQHTLDEAPASVLARLDAHADVVGEVEDRVTPAFPACEVAVVRADDALYPSPCACSTGSNCNWTQPLADGAFAPSAPAPKNLTLPPGTWSGAGCRKKACVELSGSPSMPAACAP